MYVRVMLCPKPVNGYRFKWVFFRNLFDVEIFLVESLSTLAGYTNRAILGAL